MFFDCRPRISKNTKLFIDYAVSMVFLMFGKFSSYNKKFEILSCVKSLQNGVLKTIFKVATNFQSSSFDKIRNSVKSRGIARLKKKLRRVRDPKGQTISKANYGILNFSKK